MRFALLIVAAFAASPAAAADLAVGQALACTGPGAVIAVVGQLDPDGKDGAVIASVSLFDAAPGAAVPEAGHIPIDAEVLKTSCPTVAPPHTLSKDFGEGYALWREALEARRGGYFTISISEVLQVIARILPAREETQ